MFTHRFAFIRDGDLWGVGVLLYVSRGLRARESWSVRPGVDVRRTGAACGRLRGAAHIGPGSTKLMNVW